MRYEIRFVEDHQLPAGHDWMMLESNTEFFVFIRADAVCPTVLEEVWAARREMLEMALSA